ncbi:hypothetical protein M011DRAFT_480567 [Sporormia fimetaria CBS 119925]|uniref:Uncharacterized protein n=1 Tax=Sporormia fimetaria CBS 119925 TaxID=1340428 RepID=A0A6A6V2V3_9PLEO|nr:hypothetical protein M011DRAFT_480567 [Sporormia fimetaria CBS 119925]
MRNLQRLKISVPILWSSRDGDSFSAVFRSLPLSIRYLTLHNTPQLQLMYFMSNGFQTDILRFVHNRPAIDLKHIFIDCNADLFSSSHLNSWHESQPMMRDHLQQVSDYLKQAYGVLFEVTSEWFIAISSDPNRIRKTGRFFACMRSVHVEYPMTVRDEEWLVDYDEELDILASLFERNQVQTEFQAYWTDEDTMDIPTFPEEEED